LKLSELSRADVAGLLMRGELRLDLSPFVAAIKSNIPVVARDLVSMYGQFNVMADDGFADFHIEVSFDRGIRRFIQPLARFHFDGLRSFTPLPAAQAFPMLEWGLNWCVAAHAHQYLIVHAAVIEKNGRALILPAPPGSGKSTLCAGLVSHGWRLLSDELALCAMDTGLLYGMARPISLKNASIEVMQRFAPDAVLTPSVPDTTKGTVALLRPPAQSVQRIRDPATPAWIVLPKFERGAPATLSAHSKEQTFMLLAEQSFNYDVHGARGFEAVSTLISQCDCFTFSYGELADAARVFDDLAVGTR
jgi:HprK-related kinase A